MESECVIYLEGVILIQINSCAGLTFKDDKNTNSGESLKKVYFKSHPFIKRNKFLNNAFYSVVHLKSLFAKCVKSSPTCSLLTFQRYVVSGQWLMKVTSFSSSIKEEVTFITHFRMG